MNLFGDILFCAHLFGVQTSCSGFLKLYKVKKLTVQDRYRLI